MQTDSITYSSNDANAIELDAGTNESGWFLLWLKPQTLKLLNDFYHKKDYKIYFRDSNNVLHELGELYYERFANSIYTNDGKLSLRDFQLGFDNGSGRYDLYNNLWSFELGYKMLPQESVTMTRG